MSGEGYRRRKGLAYRALRAQSRMDPTYPHKAHESRGFSKRIALCEAQNWRCCYCGTRFSDVQNTEDYGTVDHFVPVASGGAPYWENEVMACRLCNEGRGAMFAVSYFDWVQRLGRLRAALKGRLRRRKLNQERATAESIGAARGAASENGMADRAERRGKHTSGVRNEAVGQMAADRPAGFPELP